MDTVHYKERLFHISKCEIERCKNLKELICVYIDTYYGKKDLSWLVTNYDYLLSALGALIDKPDYENWKKDMLQEKHNLLTYEQIRLFVLLYTRFICMEDHLTIEKIINTVLDIFKNNITEVFFRADSVYRDNNCEYEKEYKEFGKTMSEIKSFQLIYKDLLSAKYQEDMEWIHNCSMNQLRELRKYLYNDISLQQLKEIIEDVKD